MQLCVSVRATLFYCVCTLFWCCVNSFASVCSTPLLFVHNSAVCAQLCCCLYTTLLLCAHSSLDSSHSITSQLSSVHSSQDSLHKQPQKKKGGIKSSLGRIFSKKEKGQKEMGGGAASGIGNSVAAPIPNRPMESHDVRVPPPDVISGLFFLISILLN